ncbi:hypothetical protein GCM10027293_00530 [Pontibacter aydingkolensis]
MSAAPIQAETVTQWKKAFYSAYRQKQFSRAEYIYQSRLLFDLDTPDVHAAFRQYRRNDLLVKLLAGALFAAVSLLAWLQLA